MTGSILQTAQSTDGRLLEEGDCTEVQDYGESSIACMTTKECGRKRLSCRIRPGHVAGFALEFLLRMGAVRSRGG